MKIPYWKLKREVRRIKDQFWGTLIYPLEILRTRRYDRDKHLLTRITNGHIPLSDQVAVFLVGHPASERAGVEHTLKHLVEQNFSTVLVINDSAKCLVGEWYLKYCSVVICRPNYGYDFGGYRDGLLWLEGRKSNLCELLLINDSIWFPVHSMDDTIATIRRRPCPALGLFLLEKSNRTPSNSITTSTSRPRIGSFFIFLKEPVFGNPAFWRFWHELVMSNIKRSVIKRGEHAFSDFLVREGVQLESLLSRDSLRLFLQRIPEAKLLPCARSSKLSISFVTPAGSVEQKAAVVREEIGRGYYLSACPDFLLSNKLLKFVKKSLEFDGREVLEKVIGEMIENPSQYASTVRHEIQKRLS